MISPSAVRDRAESFPPLLIPALMMGVLLAGCAQWPGWQSDAAARPPAEPVGQVKRQEAANTALAGTERDAREPAFPKGLHEGLDSLPDEDFMPMWDGRFHIVYPDPIRRRLASLPDPGPIPPLEAPLESASPVLEVQAGDSAGPGVDDQDRKAAGDARPLAGTSTETPAEPPTGTSDATPTAGSDTAPAAVPDIWPRIRAGFRILAQRHPRIEAERNWYVRNPDYLQRTLERARPYLYLIVEALAARDMPMEIALLPIVESAFQPFAYSHGRAAGIWQFIPGTARHYGLKLNWWYDGRRDILESTRAALDYLQYLHRTFDGDWLLALAAYNSGSGTVKKAIRKNRRRGKPTDFWSLRLPRETRAYVPKLLAVSEIVADPARFGITLNPIPDRPQLRVVDIGSQIDLALAAELAGLGLDDLYRYNPGFNRWATDPSGPHRLLLPVEVADGFLERLAEVPPERRIKWVRHRIREGETLGHLAQRYGTTVAVLKQVNGIRGHLIRTGHSLIIPVATRDLSSYRLSQDQRLRTTRNRPRKGERLVYTVRRGDTLWDIARAHKVGVRQLARWNGMATRDLLRPGQKLVIWRQSHTETSNSPVRWMERGPTAGQTRRIQYTVRKGDSLARISQRFKVTIAQLRKWNSLPKDKYLQPGQRLTLYVDVTRQTGS